MKIAHLTDIHLDCVDGRPHEVLPELAREVTKDLEPDVPLVITGDIALGNTFASALLQFAMGCNERTIYFVLGNHDAWRSSIAASRQAAAVLSRKHPQLVYLPAAGVTRLTEKTCLVGLDGWYDMRCGNLSTSVRLVDFNLIDDFKWVKSTADYANLRPILQDRAAECAKRAREALKIALATYQHVVFATHVPPFPAASVYNGGQSDDEHLPFFTNYSLGLALESVAADHPNKQITVLCGHSHGAGDYLHAPNLRVITGAAEYGRPAIAGVHEVG